MSKNSRIRHESKLEYFDYLKETAVVVDEYVRGFFEVHYGSNPFLRDKLLGKYRLGKSQLRPAQARMAYELVGGTDWEKIAPACASVETKDTAYYCIDDVFDSQGDPSLILLGCMLHSVSSEMVNDLMMGFSPGRIRNVISEMAELDKQNASAFLIDINLKTPDTDLYLKKVRGYNFWENALKIGAILGNASSREINRIGMAGRNIGMGYIIANDTWDFGKELEDFRAGKYTLPIIYLFRDAEADDRIKLERLFGNNRLLPGETDFVRRVAVKSGAIEKGKRMAEEYCNEGIDILKKFPESKARRMLEFATTMTQRNKHYEVLKSYE